MEIERVLLKNKVNLCMKTRFDFLTVFLFGAVVGAALALIAPYLVPSLRASSEVLRDTSSATPGAQPTHLRGDANAVVTLEEFGDFECPPCASLQAELKQVEAEYGTRLRVVFRHLPLPMHKHAEAAARASEAAALQGRFWEMHDRLYESQDEWNSSCDVQQVFKGYARDLGLDVDRFTKDMNAESVSERIQIDQQRAESIKLSSTPTLFINGRQIPTASLREKIEAALKEAGAK
jgi:protein-disulfide isomerase